MVQPAPLIVIGYTDPYEASPNYADQFETKDLSKKSFKRCKYCKDLLEKRKHRLCTVKAWVETFKQRHSEIMENIMIVVRGFKKDK